jgi:hypothetical protein
MISTESGLFCFGGVSAARTTRCINNLELPWPLQHSWPRARICFGQHLRLDRSWEESWWLGTSLIHVLMNLLVEILTPIQWPRI